MISVQNLLQQLSGNKLMWFFVGFFFLSSCGTTKKANDRYSNTTRTKTTPSTKSTTPTNTSSDKSKDGKVKVVEWTEGKDDAKPPIVNEEILKIGDIPVLKEESYDITYFVPLDATSYDPNKSSDRFINYYCGMQVAQDILEKESINLNVNLVDEGTGSIESLLRSNVNDDTDVIVGPYDRTSLKKVAKYAQENEIANVSPWQASTKIASENPYYVQLRPNLNQHYYAIFDDIKAEFPGETNLFILGNQRSTKDSKRISMLQRMGKDVFGKSDDPHFEEFLTIQDSIDIGVMTFDSIFVQDEKNIVFIPNWSFDDEDFIYGLLRRLSVEKRNAEMIVYGMPIMLESEKINFDYYKSLNMRVARSKYVDQRDNDVRRFKRDFVQRFGALPTDDAYEGYDNLMYIGRNIHKYGKRFQYFLQDDDGYYLQAKYEVEPNIEDDASDDRLDNINYFQNKNVDIIVFKDNVFVREID